MALKRLSLIRGDSQTYGITFKRADATLYNIKNWTVFFTLKTNWSIPDSQASLQKIVTTFSDTTAGTSGSASIVISPVDTVNLDPGEYDFDIAVCTNASDVHTVLRGKLDLEYDVTRSAGTAGTA
jgi:hypothetical protein